MTMQHELFLHPNKRVRPSYPLIVVLHADVAEGAERVVAPLTGAVAGSRSRMRPLIHHNGSDFVVLVRLLGLVPIRLLRHSVGSIAAYRDDLTRALDWLFFGI
jgi:toxin CcdB